MDPISLQTHLRSMSGIGGLGDLGSQAIDPALRPREIQPLGSTDAADSTTPSFKDELTRSIEAVNGQMVEADRMTEALVSGQSGDLHGTIMAMQKADISFRMLVEVRNKVIRAYEEVMRMQA